MCIGGILHLNFFDADVRFVHEFHASSILSFMEFCLEFCDSVNSVHWLNPQYIVVCLSYDRRKRCRCLVDLWDETDIASVFLKNQSKLFFGVILRVVKHFTEIRFCERPVGGITYVFRSSNKSVLWRTLHTLSGGMAYFFSKIKLKCPLAYPP